ncbi:MAG: hypothetical protein ABIT83_02270 [Massilia sp.]
MAALENQAFALMARLHVVLRREKGRVTDIEYMRVDPVYCRYVLGMIGIGDSADMRDLCGKLEEIYFGRHGLFVSAPRLPLLGRQPAAQKLVDNKPAPVVEPIIAAAAPVAAPQTYVGRLR